MATTRMEYDDRRARTELGYTSIPARAALTRAAKWYVDHGFVKGSQMERIRRDGKLDTEIDLRSATLPVVVDPAQPKDPAR